MNIMEGFKLKELGNIQDVGVELDFIMHNNTDNNRSTASATQNIRLFSRHSPRRYVLFSSKGKSTAHKAEKSGTDLESGKDEQKMIMDYATLSAMQTANTVGSNIADDWGEWNIPMMYAAKQKSLKFLSL